MDEIQNQIRYSKLLAGKVLGSLTAEQEKVLNQWEQESDNKEISDNILNAHSFADWKQNLNNVNTKEEWMSFLERMEKTTNKRKVRRLKVVKWMSSVAAVLLIGVALFSLLKTNDDYQTLESVKIAPGTSHAELVLSTGEVVNLENTLQSKINEGTVALENTKGVLQYKEDGAEMLAETKTNTLRVPRGAEYQLVLSDGTKVWLNSETELSYSVPFIGKERRVTLKGEAYFDVTPNKEIPFIVVSGNQEVEVLGTEFNISAYANDKNITTTLVEGKVKVFDVKSKDNNFLFPNQQSILNLSTNKIKKQQVDVYPYVAWKDGRFVFNNVSLEQFLSKVSRWYNVEIIFNDDSLRNLKFTGDLPRYSDMTSILKIIEAEMSVHIKVEENNKIHVFSK